MKVLLPVKCLPDALVDDRSRFENVVVKRLKLRVKAINASLSLMKLAIRVGKAVEHDRVSFDAVPTFRPCLVLDKVDPSICAWYVLMEMAVPLSHGDVKLRV